MVSRNPAFCYPQGPPEGRPVSGGVYPLQHQLRLSPCLSRPTHTPASYQG